MTGGARNSDISDFLIRVQGLGSGFRGDSQNMDFFIIFAVVRQKLLRRVQGDYVRGPSSRMCWDYLDERPWVPLSKGPCSHMA